MKKYTIKNYKGNLLESLKRFAKSHEKMRIVEAVEKEDKLDIKAEEYVPEAEEVQTKTITYDAKNNMQLGDMVTDFRQILEIIKTYRPGLLRYKEKEFLITGKKAADLLNRFEKFVQPIVKENKITYFGIKDLRDAVDAIASLNSVGPSNPRDFND